MTFRTLLFWAVVVFGGLAYRLDAAEAVRYPANPGQGFSYPYYLFVPPGVDTNTVLVVEPNNTGTTDDSFTVHDIAASNLITWRMVFAGDLRAPFLVPVFPRPNSNWWVYTHALDRDCFTTTNTALQRFDLQLMAMIADARARLTTQGVSTDSKVFIMGFSASSMFANRFTALHPGSVKAAAAGGLGGWPLAPIATWEGEDLRYNVGIQDLGTLTGTNFNLTAFASVPLYFFRGDQDTNDSVQFSDSYDAVDRDQVNQLFGATPMERWPVAEYIYTNAGCNVQFVLYPGIAHTFTEQMRDDIKRFFYPTRRFLTHSIRPDLSFQMQTNTAKTEWASLAGVTYSMESSSNLSSWFPEGSSNYLGDGFYQNYLVARSNRMARFFRLKSQYSPAGGGQGRIFFFNPTYGAGIVLTATCTNLNSGTCQMSFFGNGTFTYAEPNASQGNLAITFTSGDQLNFGLTISNNTSGTFQGTYVHGSVTNPMGGSYETLRTP